MVTTFTTGMTVPIMSWAPRDLTAPELSMVTHMANAPGVFHHAALMADAHESMGVMVGSVLPTQGVIYPGAVGKDIGCGMTAMKIPLRAALFKPKKRESIRKDLASIVAAEDNFHRSIGDDVLAWRGWSNFDELNPAILQHKDRALKQMGTLGEGNHFLEICYDQTQQDNPDVWIVLHTGSRGIGATIGDIHLEAAKTYTQQNGITVPHAHLSLLKAGTEEFNAYWQDMQWALQYAAANRQMILARILTFFSERFLQGAELLSDLVIDCHHNYVTLESHFGQEVFVTRKGAIRAGLGDLGIIPGSMGDSTYLVRGKGNPDSFMTVSHGAGRKMSRTRARNRFSPSDLANQTRGITCSVNSSLLEEAPAAYNRIEEVMAAQQDLVDIITILKQIINVKGY